MSVRRIVERVDINGNRHCEVRSDAAILRLGKLGKLGEPLWIASLRSQ